MRRLLLLAMSLSVLACGELGPDPDAYVSVGWNLTHDASSVALLCEEGETVEASVAGVTASAPCAPPVGTSYRGAINIVHLNMVPTGTQTLELALKGPAGDVRGSLRTQVELVSGGQDVGAFTIPVSSSGAVGGLAFTWQLKSPDLRYVCSGAGRDAMLFETAGQSLSFPAGPQWIDDRVTGGPAESGVFSAITPSIPVGQHVTRVRLMNTQNNSVQAETTLQTTSVGGRTALADHFVFTTCPP